MAAARKRDEQPGFWEGHAHHDDPSVDELKQGKARLGIDLDRAKEEPIDKALQDPTRHPLETELAVEQARLTGADHPYLPPGPIRAPEQGPPLNMPYGDAATAPLTEGELEHIQARRDHILDPDRAIAAGLTARG